MRGQVFVLACAHLMMPLIKVVKISMEMGKRTKGGRWIELGSNAASEIASQRRKGINETDILIMINMSELKKKKGVRHNCTSSLDTVQICGLGEAMMHFIYVSV